MSCFDGQCLTVQQIAAILGTTTTSTAAPAPGGGFDFDGRAAEIRLVDFNQPAKNNEIESQEQVKVEKKQEKQRKQDLRLKSAKAPLPLPSSIYRKIMDYIFR